MHANYTFFPELQNNIYNAELLNNTLSNDSVIDYTKTLPDCKLYYPEPFIASASFLHEEIWFIHILHYNYWLWFFFITLIMFYFVTFIHMVRWCNLRIKPKRETRGVSRSKCADLITACVPVSWALSIIISETVDATDYYDGFGTGEVVIGIRAYQWGWEYFYPKNLDLNYNVNPSYSTVIGNSIKYNNTTAETLDTNTLWKFYQRKHKTAQSTTPNSLILSPNNYESTLNNIDFSFIGNNISNDANAFNKIQRFSKLSVSHVSSALTNHNTTLTKLNNLYLSPSTFDVTSYQYGSCRQHNVSSLNVFLPTFSTLLDNSSFNKFFNYSCNIATLRKISFQGSLKFMNTLPLQTNNSEFLSGKKKFLDVLPSLYSITQPWHLYTATTDSKKHSNPLRIFSLPQPKKDYNNTLKSNFNLSTPHLFTQNLFNLHKHYRVTDLKFEGSSLLTPDKNNRLTINKALTTTNFEVNPLPWSAAFLQNVFEPVKSPYLNTFNTIKTNFIFPNLYQRSLLNNTTSSFTTNPLSSFPITFSYDKVMPYSNDDSPAVLRGKEDSAPNYLFTSHWLTYYSNLNLHHKYAMSFNNVNKSAHLYLPTPLTYAEYDFKNLQATETVEDLLWESSHSIFAQEDYLSPKDFITTSTYGGKFHDFFKGFYWDTDYPLVKASQGFKIHPVLLPASGGDKESFWHNFKVRPENIPGLFKNIYNPKPLLHIELKLPKLYKPLLTVLDSTPSDTSTSVYGLPISTEGLFINPQNLPLTNFFHLTSDFLLDSTEDAYENLKVLKNLSHYATHNIFLTGAIFNSIRSFTNVLDPFRADFDDAAWTSNYEGTVHGFNTPTVQNDLKLTNTLKLRSTAKNSVVTYNAIQKVYKARFDDLRANINFSDITNSYASYPFLTESKAPYETMLKKNKETFYNLNFYHPTFKTNYSTLVNVFTSLNINFTDIPFLLSLKSDAARYLWFDWQARWSSLEVQPSSIAKYSLAGLPYTSKKYEYTSALGDELNDSENYLTKIARARKNFLPSWAYSPYFYSRVTNWFLIKNMQLFFNDVNTFNTKLLLKQSKFYWETRCTSTQFVNNTFVPTYSGLNRANVITWSPLSGIAAYYYNTTVLNDILTKRENLYRSFFLTKTHMCQIPKYIHTAPNNPLVREVQAAYPFIDPTTYSSEVTRECLYNNTEFLQYSLIRDFLKVTNKALYQLPINFTLLNNYFIHLSGITSHYETVSGNLDLYKSQYRPMRKGITNMIRLQATNAIAMPTEIRLHILASSKDVIHSWAIPSAGIKIDCVPGFSSHRVAIFLQHGIFWGQCMEICGRYHHWMPIVVYFMKRDLFFLWCTHFIHYSDVDHSFNMSDKQLSSYIRLVSFDKTTWLNEINNLLV